MALVIHLVDEEKRKEDKLVVGKKARSQMVWWLLS